MNRYLGLVDTELPEVVHFAWNHNRHIGISNESELWYWSEGFYNFRVWAHINNWMGEIYVNNSSTAIKTVHGSSAELLMEKLEEYYWNKLYE